MATINFSVPDDINIRFSRTFKGRNKSAILSRLMELAVEQEEQRKRRIKAMKRVVVDASVAVKRLLRYFRKAKRFGAICPLADFTHG